jgi:Exocyst complex component Sec10
LENAKDQDVKGEPDFSYLQNVKIAVSIIHLLSAYSNTALIPLASSSLTIRREMSNYCITNISALEKKVNAIFQATHESMSFEIIANEKLCWLPQSTVFQGKERMISNFEMMIKRSRIYRQT